jgi:radical SAM-linked protein
MRFGKYGELKFIGHLDIMRYFQKCMRRAKVDIKYSGGYSPHQIMSFAQPLGLGVTSDGEYMDIEVNSTDTSERMIERINAANVENIRIYSYRLLPEKSKTGMAIIAAADYEIRFRYPEKMPFALKEIWPKFIAQEQILVEKKTKSGSKEVDIKPLIFEHHLMEDGIFVKLSCGSVVNLKPEVVMEALYAFAGAQLGPFDLLLHRKNLYTEQVYNGEADRTGEMEQNLDAPEETAQPVKHHFIALEDMGVDILEPMTEAEPEENAVSE